MPRCPKCRKVLSRVDWPNHDYTEHWTEEEREVYRQKARAEKDKRPKPKPMTDEDWAQLTRGE